MFSIDDFLSQRGREISYPKSGLLMQTQQASNSTINATVGLAYDDQLELMCYSGLRNSVAELKTEQIVGYASSFGIPRLRQQWRELLIAKNPGLVDKLFSLPVVTCGITQSLAIAGYLFLDPGTPVLLPDLFWPNYRLLFARGCGADLRFFTTFTADGLNIAGLATLLQSKEERKIVLLNFPNNPTGYSPTQQEVDQLAGLLCRHAEQGEKIIVLCDDAYWGLSYDDRVAAETVFAQFANLHPNVLLVKHDGVTKEEFGWGLRVGFITFAGAGLQQHHLEILSDKAGAVVRGSVSNISRLSQELVLKLLADRGREAEQQNYRQLLRRRYQALRQLLEQQQQPYFAMLPCNSGYFLTVRLTQKLAEEVRLRLLHHYSTGVIAIGDDCLRLAFSTVRQQDFAQLVANLLSACQDVFA